MKLAISPAQLPEFRRDAVTEIVLHVRFLACQTVLAGAVWARDQLLAFTCDCDGRQGVQAPKRIMSSDAQCGVFAADRLILCTKTIE